MEATPTRIHDRPIVFAKAIERKFDEHRYEPNPRQYVERGQPQALLNALSRWRARAE
jgi:hypothetical protein